MESGVSDLDAQLALRARFDIEPRGTERADQQP
jgi:hypothetical protein